MSYYPEFAESIESRLAKEDRPSKWLADRLGVSPSTVTRWLNEGTRPGNPDVVVRIADVLQIEKVTLLIAAGYGYREAPNVKNQTATENETNSDTENPSQKKTSGGIHFYAPPVIHGDVIADSTVHKTTYSNAEGIATRKDIQENVQDERTTASGK